MAYNQESATENIRGTVYDGILKGFAMASYKFKQACLIIPTKSWNNFFFRENPTALTAASGNSIKGIPRGADFPQASVQWERVLSVMEKYGLEDTIPW